VSLFFVLYRMYYMNMYCVEH